MHFSALEPVSLIIFMLIKLEVNPLKYLNFVFIIYNNGDSNNKL